MFRMSHLKIQNHSPITPQSLPIHSQLAPEASGVALGDGGQSKLRVGDARTGLDTGDALLYFAMGHPDTPGTVRVERAVLGYLMLGCCVQLCVDTVTVRDRTG